MEVKTQNTDGRGTSLGRAQMRGHWQPEAEKQIGVIMATEHLPCARQNACALSHLIFSTTYEADIISLILQEKKQA